MPHRDDGIWSTMSLWKMVSVHTNHSNSWWLLHSKGMMREEEAFFSPLSQPPQDQQGLSHGVMQCLISLAKCTLHTCKWSHLSCTAFLYSEELSNEKLLKGRWNSKLKINTMEITWSCVSGAGPQQPWGSQQRSLPAAAAPLPVTPEIHTEIHVLLSSL